MKLVYFSIDIQVVLSQLIGHVHIQRITQQDNIALLDFRYVDVAFRVPYA